MQELNTSVPVAASSAELSEDFLSQFQVPWPGAVAGGWVAWGVGSDENGAGARLRQLLGLSCRRTCSRSSRRCSWADHPRAWGRRGCSGGGQRWG